MKGILNTPTDIENFIKPFEVIRKTIGDAQFVINVVKADEQLHMYVQDGGKTVMATMRLNINEIFTNFEYSSDHEKIGIRDINVFLSKFRMFKSNLTISTENNGSAAGKILLTDERCNVECGAADPSIIDEAPQTLKAKATQWVAEFSCVGDTFATIKDSVSYMQEKYIKFINENNKLSLQISDPGAGADVCTAKLDVDVDKDVDINFFRERIGSVIGLATEFDVKISNRVSMWQCDPQNTSGDIIIYVAAST